MTTICDLSIVLLPLSSIMKKLCFLATTIMLLVCAQTFAQTDSIEGQNSIEGHDSIEFSLLTCAPGNEIYSLFGHTAIRYRNITHQRDWTFNYGVFNFKQKNFALRFATGKTDYELGVFDYDDFKKDYIKTGRSITEQVLNLTPEEKVMLEATLFENARKENRTYRYNYFYRNCTTEARDKILSLVHLHDISITDKRLSFRDAIHLYTNNYPWSELAMDLCIGIQADRIQEARYLCFLPDLLMAIIGSAHITHGSSKIEPLVKDEHTLSVNVAKSEEKGFPLNPLQCMAVVAIVIVVFFFYEFKKEKFFVGIDIILLAFLGIVGCVLTIIMIGEHPCVRYNLNILLMNPLAFLTIPFVIIADKKKYHSRWWKYFELVFVILIMADIIGIQDIPIVVEIMASFLLIRSLERRILMNKGVFLDYQKKKNDKK